MTVPWVLIFLIVALSHNIHVASISDIYGNGNGNAIDELPKLVIKQDESAEIPLPQTDPPQPTIKEPTTTEATTTEATTTEATTTEATTTEATTTEATTTEATTTEATTTEATTTEATTTEATTTEANTAEPTTAEPTTAEPTTAEPTTVEPTTAEPTTAEPTTAEPTTAEPTTLIPGTTKSPIEAEVDYTVKDETGIPCIGAKMQLTLYITYNTTESKVARKTLTVPKNAKPEGSCGDNESSLKLVWSPSSTNVTLAETDENFVNLKFVKKDSVVSIKNIAFELYLDEKNFPDASPDQRLLQSSKDVSLFSASAGNIYACSLETVEQMKDVNLSFKDVRIFAFNKETSISAKTEENCVAESDIGAIVGGVIGGLIGVAIIAFFIWRCRRNANKGFNEP